MKKILILLSVIMLIAYSSAFADEQAGILTLESSMDTSGNLVVTVGISENSNSCGGSFSLIYDSTKLKITSYKQSELLSPYSCFVNLTYKNDTARFSWAGTEELTKGGELFAVSFTPIANSSFETDIVTDNPKLADSNGNRISVTGDNCKITYKPNNSLNHRNSGGTAKNSNSKNANDEKKIEVKLNIFSDVNETDWFYDSVMSIYELGLMQGMSENSFEPNIKLTRAMFITVMHRISDIPKVKGQAVFTDVDDGAWYADAVAWGYENKIISGISETEFAPNDYITREQIATILYRYAKYKDVNVDNIANTADMSPYPDTVQISDWAINAMRYCISKKIITGDDTGNIFPQNYASRAEMAAMIVRFIKEF
mgnify:CR=1 FL=1